MRGVEVLYSILQNGELRLTIRPTLPVHCPNSLTEALELKRKEYKEELAQREGDMRQQFVERVSRAERLTASGLLQMS